MLSLEDFKISVYNKKMDILKNIPELTEDDCEVKISLFDIQKLHKSLTLENPLTYKLFLSKRLDLKEDEREIYTQIIKRLESNERIRYQKAMKDMIIADYGR